MEQIPLTVDDYEGTIEEILALADRYDYAGRTLEDQGLSDTAEDIRRIVRVNLGRGF